MKGKWAGRGGGGEVEGVPVYAWSVAITVDQVSETMVLLAEY